MGDEMFFWRNLNFLKAVWNLSFSDMSDAFNREVPGLGMTKSQLDYKMRLIRQECPSDGILAATDRLFCNRLGLRGDKRDIRGCGFTINDAAWLATEGQVDRSGHDRNIWTRNFWDNYDWLEKCFRMAGKCVPMWDSAGKHSYTLRKNRSVLPSPPVLEETASLLGLKHYPVVYLRKLTSHEMLGAYACVSTSGMNHGYGAGRLLVDAASVHLILSEAPDMLTQQDREEIRRICVRLEGIMQGNAGPLMARLNAESMHDGGYDE